MKTDCTQVRAKKKAIKRDFKDELGRKLKTINRSEYEIPADLNTLTVCELRAIARYHGLCKYSYLKRDGLIELLERYQIQPDVSKVQFSYPGYFNTA